MERDRTERNTENARFRIMIGQLDLLGIWEGRHREYEIMREY